MKVALVHDWLGTYRGGEKVLEQMSSLYPDAPIFTLFYSPEALSPSLREREIITPPWFGGCFKSRKLLLPILPALIEAFDLDKYDLILSSSSCVAKGVIPHPSAKHVSYVHSPMRYLWDQRFEYLTGMRKLPLGNLIVESIFSRLRVWDAVSAHRVDQFIANSSFVADRIQTYYGRSSKVLNPSIDDRFFDADLRSLNKRNEHFLVAGAFVSYKRFDLAIEWANKFNQPLVVMGNGPDLARLQSLAKSSIRFVIQPSDEEWLEHLSGARALLFPGVEDFGMVPIEAMALGTPVIGLDVGGAVDYLRNSINAQVFKTQQVDDMQQAVLKFQDLEFTAENIRESVAEFRNSRFRDSLKAIIQSALGGSS
jgi:glycosyltransferase involved in cell wall biosynthesis